MTAEEVKQKYLTEIGDFGMELVLDGEDLTWIADLVNTEVEKANEEKRSHLIEACKLLEYIREISVRREQEIKDLLDRVYY